MPETRKTSAAKAKATKPRQSPKKSKPGPKPKAGPKKQPVRKPLARKSLVEQPGQLEIWSFIQQQAEINKTVLDKLQGLTDKCKTYPIDHGGGESKNRQSGAGASKGCQITSNNQDVQMLSESGSSDEYDTDHEDQVNNDLMEANIMLQPRFTNTKGKSISHRRKLEIAIKTDRPFAYLDRETQRSIVRDGGHPEELPLILHIEGLIAMLTNRSSEGPIKGLANHVLQVIRDVQVHSWSKIRKWSNEVILNTAMQTWSWVDSDRITQARNSQYLAPNPNVENQNVVPCYKFNKGECKHDIDHCGLDLTFTHICAFCFAIDGTPERHPSRGCSKKRSSANYFKNRDENKDQRTDRKFKPKRPFNGGQNEEKSKN